MRRGGSRVFSRGGGGFSKNFRKFCRPFIFLGRPNSFSRALPKHSLVPVLAKFSAPQAKF